MCIRDSFPNTELCSATELDEKCRSAIKCLMQTVKSLKLKEAFAGVLDDRAVRVVAECVRYCNAKGFGGEVGKELEALNTVLMMGLEGRPRKICLGKHMYSALILSLIHICRCRRYAVCRSRWSPYH
eukprot:TRINITY_DN11053_c0_g2_i1.p1 TRINITY_DN11053_c0_g2~~TRINITY_DN11053_c0_g2_i1.p1  ORF type:complete len:127 (-),score=21.13 TRINITY_DN11053_c0_g2_i1:23-403(-)